MVDNDTMGKMDTTPGETYSIAQERTVRLDVGLDRQMLQKLSVMELSKMAASRQT